MVPVCYQDHILSVAHDHHFSGHRGVTKTLDHITRYFYWPGINSDVAKYCRTCNTIMCTLTRFLHAVPLQNINVPAVVKALITFFSLFGLPKVVQTDRGTNFMSRVFMQAMRQLEIKHVQSTATAPTQGALERFHLTLKSMLKSFCLEFERDWDEGVPLALFAIREVVQESLGFSRSELVFGYTVCGPLKLLRESFLSEKNE